MKTKLNAIASALFLLLAPAAMAANVAVITLENGANVRLKDDFTWEYIITETVTQPVQAAKADITEQANGVTSPVIAPATSVAVTAPVAAQTVATPSSPTVNTQVSTTRLTAAALAQPELLGSTAKDGIKITLADTKWKGDKLGLVFDFDSTSNEHVTVVEVEVSFYNDNGALLKTEKLEAWEAIFRMPETYLRKGQHRQSDTIWVEGVNKQQWQKQLISLKIIEIESR
ncbi:DUF3157 family protein [Shewanella frigidimarina]|uniref:DUF3157 domain-containing protein n=1 Tax=Shewanella frigidimarina TaxID=56812 RepID=A0A125BEH9_SHEFR|nr:DUF3157 family protein [Shewanella frigidimarina]KVX01868.1 hypothetical protein AWJ07_04625 [Shewanella frigidimarina]